MNTEIEQIESDEGKLSIVVYVAYAVVATLCTIILCTLKAVGILSIHWFYCFVMMWAPAMIVAFVIGLYLIACIVHRIVNNQ